MHMAKIEDEKKTQIADGNGGSVWGEGEKALVVGKPCHFALT